MKNESSITKASKMFLRSPKGTNFFEKTRK